MQALTFQSTQFDVVDRDGQPWLRGRQIDGALGYKADSVSRIYDRNADEFTDRMTALVELDTAGGKQQVRIFSLRGAWLLAMLSRTKVAKEFRAWVLDVLEGITEPKAPTPKRRAKALPGGLTVEQQDAIKGMIKARVDAMPEDKRAKAAITCWSALKSKFGRTYKEITPEHFSEAISLVARLPLDGEPAQQELALSAGPISGIQLPMDNPLVKFITQHGDNRRWMLSCGYGASAQIAPIPEDACIVTDDTLPSMLGQFSEAAVSRALARFLPERSTKENQPLAGIELPKDVQAALDAKLLSLSREFATLARGFLEQPLAWNAVVGDRELKPGAALRTIADSTLGMALAERHHKELEALMRLAEAVADTSREMMEGVRAELCA